MVRLISQEAYNWNIKRNNNLKKSHNKSNAFQYIWTGSLLEF